MLPALRACTVCAIMVCFVPKKRNLTALFGVGFAIGILLEVALVEKQKLTNLKLPFAQFEEVDDARVACVVFLKGSTSDNLAAANDTWMVKCDEIFPVRVTRRGKDGASKIRERKKNAGGSRSSEEAHPRERKKGEERGRKGASRIFELVGDSAWSGMCKVLRLVRKGDSQWFILVPDNLMVIVENLKRFVGRLNWEREHYFGHAVGHFEADYNALAAGILMSRGALVKLLGKFESDESCDSSGRYWRNEDVYLGKYLKEIGIYPKDTRDAEGRGRFLGYNLNVLLHPGKLFKKSDYTRKALFPVPEGLDCCSPDLITIDATDSDRMYHHYFYIYQMGFKRNALNAEKLNDIAKKTKQDGFSWREFLKKEGYSEGAIENITDEEYYRIWARKISPERLYEKMRRDFGPPS